MSSEFENKHKPDESSKIWREPEAEGVKDAEGPQPEKLSWTEVDRLMGTDDKLVYLMTTGASVFYGFEPFTGKLDAMKRITVSQMHPHYSNPIEVADELESLFKSLGATVIRSVFTDSKAL